MKSRILLVTLFFVLTGGLLWASSTTNALAPAAVFDLQQWKLDVPGPLEIRELAGYSSPYFYLTSAREMCFHLDAADKGHTPNTEYVRSELRHLPNWDSKEHHALSAVVRAFSHFSPDKVTLVQIHGMTPQKTNAPPLLRVALNDGDLVAIIKTDSSGHENDSTLLVKGLGSSPVKIAVVVDGGRLKVWANNQLKVDRSLAFWPFLNYFKAGCYPQATHGTGDILFSSLSAR